MVSPENFGDVLAGLNVMKYIYLFRMENKDEDHHPIPVTRPHALALIILVGAVILIGTVFAPWFGYADAAAGNLF